jgi:hypothetical protein
VIGGLATIVEAPRFDVRGPWERFREIDRGSYDLARAPGEAIAWAADIAAQMTGRELRVDRARALRLVAGDYVLAHHDPIRDGEFVEVAIDVSPGVVPGAALHYRRRGAVYFMFPSRPGTAAVVERGPSVTSNHTYLSKRLADPSVVRIVVLLASRSS